MISKDSKLSSGFTIVELLIVIVVIGILASIAVVAYNGVQLRANNSSRTSLAYQMKTVFDITKIDTSIATVKASLQYDTWYRACLGTGYPDINSDGVRDCAAWNGNPFVSETANFNAILAKTAKVPSMGTYRPVVATSGDVYYGPYISSITVDGQDSLSLEYFLEGIGQSCSLSPLIYVTGSSTYTLTPQGALHYTSSADGITVCKILATN
ncbi:MAG: putative Fimbral protein [Candidatus Saccharibacteria bacterium]|nr:putative Fimbral protein [Candidatus Saccharibacteria bacterium]